jgi:putative DNA primase/helicase
MTDYNISKQGDSEGYTPKSYKDLRSSLQPIEWEWKGWLPKGFLTIVAGESGAGKSAVCLRLAACFTDDLPWPDGTPYRNNGPIVWCETEASQSVNLDRITKWGFSVEKILIPTDNPLEDINLDNFSHRKLILKAASQPEVKALFFDSLSGGHKRDENSTRMLDLVKFLAVLARDHKIPVLLVHHLRKKGNLDDNTVEMDRLRGSSSILQSARVIWALDDPDSNSGIKRLRVIKSNLGAKPNPIGYRVDENGVHFGNTPMPISKISAAEEAGSFLGSILQDGPVDAQEIYKKADEFGIQKRTLNAAKSKLGVRSYKEREKNGKWFWELPKP